MIKRFVLCTTMTVGLIGTAVLAPTAMASGAKPNEDPYVVSISGTIKGGFVEIWNDGSVVYVPTIGKQHHACARDADDLSYCLGLVDGRMNEELALKIALDHQ